MSLTSQNTLTMCGLESSVVENQELTQIFTKYLHDIVLEISFLDINSQNWIDVGHMRLCQKSFKIQYIFEKFLRMVDRHDSNDFLIQKFFWLGPFFDLFLNLMDRKNAPSQKNHKHKKSIFTCPSTNRRNI